jgi:glycosyltransferase involved in cell wall biosynthesis
MAIEAASPLLKAGKCTLDVVGDGPEMPFLRDLVARLGIIDKVNFHGWLKHDQVMATLAECHAMLFPSIREFGGGVVLEAMARGVFPIIVDYGGPGELVTKSTGVAIPIGDRGSIVAGCRQALVATLDNPRALDAARRAAIAHCRQHFTWTAKAKQIRRVYEWVLGGTRPDSNLVAEPASDLTT